MNFNLFCSYVKRLDQVVINQVNEKYTSILFLLSHFQNIHKYSKHLWTTAL